MRRFLIHLFFRLAALMTLGLVALTIRGFWIADCCQINLQARPMPDGKWSGKILRISSGGGRFYWVVTYLRGAIRHPNAWSVQWHSHPVADFIPILIRPTESADYILFSHGIRMGRPLGSSFIDPTGKDISLQERDIVVPAWGPLGLGTAVSLWLFLILLRQRRIARWVAEGLCLQCGYDLRAHKAGDKCPECGTPKPPANAPAK